MIHRGKHPAACLYHLEVALQAETTTGTGFLQNYIESILDLQDASCRLTQDMQPWFSRFQKLLFNPVE
ncbi:hypothetical protein RGQ29_021116 [Quercus rubra]|uniref:Uncharacterized protein n=1 Tax=Quercus rubra TaxID=3512 RepID=A0AAN7IYF0_QUERU|nr:hypothetical protein RGQ29_021116 [Quercus rubra]